MKVRNQALLLHPLFLGSIFILLLNDISLKYEFSNALTGKLSDFSGLFGLSVFGMAFMQSRKQRLLFNMAIAGLFIWWKSPLSGPLINAINGIGWVTIGRVVDYTDLSALIVLPVAVYFVEHANARLEKSRPWLVRSVCVFAVFCFCQTSLPRYAQYYRIDRIYFGEEFKTKKTEEQVLDLFTSQGSSWRIDSVFYYPMTGEKIFYRRSDSAWQPVQNSGDSTLYVEKEFDNFYLVDFHVAAGDTLRDMEISFDTTRRRMRVRVRSFQKASGDIYLLPEKVKKYKKHFKKLFE